jgi:hypothetical protein
MKRRKFRGTYFKFTVRVLESLHSDDSVLESILFDLLHQGALENELYCSAMLYDMFFRIETATIENICETCNFIDHGLQENFWLSFYQAADLLEKLNYYNINANWKQNKSQDQLLRQAKNNFTKLPIFVSDITLRDIEEKRCNLWSNWAQNS